MTLNHALGLMCGTFDPPHAGHLQLAHWAAEQIPLQQVLFLPVGQPTHKTTLTAAPHRRAMTELAIAEHPQFGLDTADMDRLPPHYTATLLPILRRRYPTTNLWLILGEDSLRDLPRWYKPEDILAQCRLAVCARPGVHLDWEALEAAVPGVGAAVRWLAGTPLSLSSTAIRHALAEGQEQVAGLPAAVATYARRYALY